MGRIEDDMTKFEPREMRPWIPRGASELWMSVKEVGVEGRMGWLELLLSLKEIGMEPRKIETEFLV